MPLRLPENSLGRRYLNISLFDYLCCPICKKSLSKKSGRLSCGWCGIDYEIRNGIPILVNLKSLPKQLRGQIEYFEKEDEKRTDYRLEPWQGRYIDNFLRYGRPKKGGVIIDDAAGSGYITMELAKLGYRVIATDLTFKELIRLKRVIEKFKLSDKVLLICANSESLPVKSNEADGLVASAILEHLPQEKQAIDEITRVVKRGAPIMVAMPLVYRYLWPFLWPVNFWHDRRIGHLRRYSREEILVKFKGYGEVYTYYTGYLLKVVCLAVYFLTRKTFWNKLGEQLDRLFERVPYGASNVVSILKKL